MLKNMLFNHATKRIEGLPTGLTTIFLADVTNLPGPCNFCAVICPDSFRPIDNPFYFLIAGAWVAHFSSGPRPVLIDTIVRGHKDRNGSFNATYTGDAFAHHFECAITCHDGMYSFEGHSISPENILADL